MDCLGLMIILAAMALFALVVVIKLLLWLLRAVGLLAPARYRPASPERPAFPVRLPGFSRVLPGQLWRHEFAVFKAERDMSSAALLQYVADAALTGMDQAEMNGRLLAKGWAPDEVKKGLADFSAFVAKHPLPAVTKAG